ncbi:hypothetical protein BES08_28655 (plasmid) [Novosphingobium resinovorum]|uniref:Uncharacterized protein n=1 Tax=Novosphingobium resinovorum TaxID=158500 RepID=A0A1D8AF75_9SPHN|nr:hypothetical protein BES08_28655 [Novosphingobium resinovorum]
MGEREKLEYVVMCPVALGRIWWQPAFGQITVSAYVAAVRCAIPVGHDRTLGQPSNIGRDIPDKAMHQGIGGRCIGILDK